MELSQLYKEYNDRMLKGGFELRSWTSNVPSLRNEFKKDKIYVEYSSDLESLRIQIFNYR